MTCLIFFLIEDSSLLAKIKIKEKKKKNICRKYTKWYEKLHVVANCAVKYFLLVSFYPDNLYWTKSVRSTAHEDVIEEGVRQSYARDFFNYLRSYFCVFLFLNRMNISLLKLVMMGEGKCLS